MKIDPYQHKEKYLAWKNSLNGKIEGINGENSAVILAYLNDMERGINVASGNVKGTRSYCRLTSLREDTYFSPAESLRLGLVDSISRYMEA
jgi:hypothetical protein